MKKSALVLSGGGALGIAHIGAIEVLAKEYKFEWYAGVSAGAIIVSLMAIGKTPSQINQIVKKYNMFKLLFDFHPSQFGFMSGVKIEDAFDEIFDEIRIEDLKIPLLIGATDFSTGERVTIRSGKITEALRASVSVPVMLEPYWHEEQDRWLVDGGLSQNFPLDLPQKEYEGRHIIGVDVGASIDTDVDFAERNFWKRGETVSHAFARAIRIMFKHQQKAPKDKRSIVLEPDIGKYQATEIKKYKELKAAGRKEARKLK